MFGKLKYLHHSQKHIEKDEDGDFFFFGKNLYMHTNFMRIQLQKNTSFNSTSPVRGAPLYKIKYTCPQSNGWDVQEATWLLALGKPLWHPTSSKPCNWHVRVHANLPLVRPHVNQRLLRPLAYVRIKRILLMIK